MGSAGQQWLYLGRCLRLYVGLVNQLANFGAMAVKLASSRIATSREDEEKLQVLECAQTCVEGLSEKIERSEQHLTPHSRRLKSIAPCLHLCHYVTFAVPHVFGPA